MSFYLQIHETIESINQLKIQRDFMLSFSISLPWTKQLLSLLLSSFIKDRNFFHIF